MTILTSADAEALIADQGKDIIIPSIYTEIPYGAFEWSGLTSVVIPDGITKIGDWAFWDNELTNVTIPDSVNSIGLYSFEDNPITSIELGNGLASSQEGIDWLPSSVRSIVFKDSVTNIGDHAFKDSKLTNVEFGENVSVIGDFSKMYGSNFEPFLSFNYISGSKNCFMSS